MTAKRNEAPALTAHWIDLIQRVGLQGEEVKVDCGDKRTAMNMRSTFYRARRELVKNGSELVSTANDISVSVEDTICTFALREHDRINTLLSCALKTDGAKE